MKVMFCGRGLFKKRTTRADVRLWVTRKQLCLLADKANMTVRDVPCLDIDYVVTDKETHKAVQIMKELSDWVPLATYDDFFHTILPAELRDAGIQVNWNHPFWLHDYLKEIEKKKVRAEGSMPFLGTGKRAIDL